MKLKAAQGVEVTCDRCNRRVQIVLEPGAIGMDEDNRPDDQAQVTNCPFCGSAYSVNDFIHEKLIQF